MSISNNGKRRKPPFVLSEGAGAFIVALMLLASGFSLIGSTPITAALAQEENNNTTVTATTPGNTTTITTLAASSDIELSQQPVYQEQVRDEGEIPINQTHIQLSFSGNGTLNVPDGTEPIRTTSRGSGIASMIGTFAGKEILTTEDGSESATVTFYEIVRFGEQQQGRGIAIAVFETNSTAMLAPLDGMILVGVDELPADGNSVVTLWEWQSGIPLSPTTATTGEPPLTNRTTTTNATDTSGIAAEDEGEQQATPTLPPTPLLE
jgi:hypothetical protein